MFVLMYVYEEKYMNLEPLGVNECMNVSIY